MELLLSILVILLAVHVYCSPSTESYLAYNNAIEYQRSNDNANALLSYQLALSYDNEFPEAHQNLGLLLESFGNIELAIHHHEMSILYAATSEFKSSAIVNLVLVRLKSSSILSNEESEMLIGRLHEAQQLNPMDDNIEFTIGLIRDQMGRPDEAFQSFQRILLGNPNHSLALMNVGNHYFRQAQYALACEYYERALLNVPDYDKNRRVLVLNNLGQSYREQSLYNAALLRFLEAAATQTDKKSLRSIKSSVHFYSINNVYTIQGLLCKWKDYELYEHLIESFLVAANSNSSEMVLSHEVNLRNLVDPYTMSLMRYSSLSFDRMVCQSACTASPVYSYPSSGNRTSKLLRVGYLSFDWRDHPMGRLTSFLVTSHNASRILSHSFSYGNNDGSSIRRLIQTNSPEFIDLRGVRNDFEAASIVASKHLDVLIDITAHTYNGRINIAALKPAPIVINYLGFPGTTGCSGFDYSMVDKLVLPPESVEGFSESVLYLPHSYQANNMPMSVAPCTHGRVACRLERGLISVDSYFGSSAPQADTLLKKHSRPEVQWICSFNANKKMEPLSFSSWTNILLRVPSAILILLDIPADARAELLLKCSHLGISHSRVLFSSRMAWSEHLFRTAACDLVLDTFVYGAHTTSSDVLWMHVPIVTLRSFGSGRMPSRVAGSILHSLIPEDRPSSPLHLLIADTVKEYEDTAVKLLKNERLLNHIHALIAAQSLIAPTFNRYLMEVHVERGYQATHDVRGLLSRETAPHVWITSQGSTMLEPAAKELMQELRNGSKDYSTCSFARDVSQLWNCLLIQPSGSVNKDSIFRASAVSKRLIGSFPTHQEAEAWKRIAEGMPKELDASMIVSAVESLYPQRFEENFDLSLRSLTNVISSELAKDSQRTLFAILDAQAVLSKNCEKDLILFKVVESLLLVRCSAFDLGSVDSSLVEALHAVPPTMNPTFYCPSLLLEGMDRLVVAHVLQNHALCTNDLWAALGSTAVNNFIGTSLSAASLGFQLDMLSFGLKLSDIQHDKGTADVIEYGFRVSTIGLLKDHVAKYVLHSAARPRQDGGPSVVFFCYEYGQSWWPGWGPSTIARGQSLGGSEEAVYQTATELSKQGYQVFIFSEIPEQDTGKVTHENDLGGRITWLHHTNLELTSTYDIFIAWRYSLSLSLGKRVARKSYLWLHDLVPGSVLPMSVFSDHDGVLVQSTFHKQYVVNEVSKYMKSRAQFDPIALIGGKIYITHNGVTLPTIDFINEPLRNDNNVFIYGSAPNRGLGLVLLAWPQIKKSIPEARLEVYYGFTEAVVKHMRQSMGEEAFARWYEQVMSLLQQEGVHYFGAVDPDTLLNAYQNAGFWLYPTTFQETGCITGIKAMVSGAIPVTSRLQESVLIELTDRYDLGPSIPLNLSVVESNKLNDWLIKEWVPSVLRAHSFTPEELDSHRRVMRYEVAQEYTWRNTALKLSALFKRDLQN